MRRKRDIPFETHVQCHWTDIPVSICFTIALIAIGLAIAINFRPLYYLNIKWLGLSESTGLNPVVIKENYNALINYCSPFCFSELSFPSLRSSASAISHFAEVKQIFNVIYISGFISIIICVVSFILKRRNSEYKFYRTCSITAVVIPVVVAVASAINFNALFIAFHRLVFSNDDWIFDPVTDPIIDLLPEVYFMECAMIIVATVLIGALVTLLLYFHFKHKQREVRLLPRKQNYYY